jgi:hypothetical protein
MGLRRNGDHVFGLVMKKDPKTREATDIAVVEANGYAISPTPEGGAQIVFSDKEGTVVAVFGPGEWEDVDIDFTDDPEGFKVGEEPPDLWKQQTS